VLTDRGRQDTMKITRAKVKAFRKAMLDAQRGESTQEQYKGVIRMIVQQFGTVTPRNLIRFIMTKVDDVSVGRLRAYKCAVRAYLLGKGKPLTPKQDEELNAILNGIECTKGKTPKKRGAPTANDVKVLAEKAIEEGCPQEAAAIIIGFGVGLRPRDAAELEGWQIDVENGVVWVERKCPRLKKIRKGKYEARPIGTVEAKEVLASLQTPRNKNRRVLPRLDLVKVSRIVQAVADEHRWDDKLLWTGLHNMRHGRAAAVNRMAIGMVQAAGSWESETAARGYAELARVCPLDRR